MSLERTQLDDRCQRLVPLTFKMKILTPVTTFLQIGSGGFDLFKELVYNIKVQRFKILNEPIQEVIELFYCKALKYVTQFLK